MNKKISEKLFDSKSQIEYLTESDDYKSLKDNLINLSGEKRSARALFIKLEKLMEKKNKAREKLIKNTHIENTAEIAGGIAHQFNNILNSITGSIELLELELPKNPYVKRCNKTIFSSVKRMTALTEKLLAYAKIGRHLPGKIQINSIVNESILLVKEIVRNEIELDISISEELLYAKADSSNLKMAISALITNAAEAVNINGKIKVSTYCEKVLNLVKKNKSTTEEYIVISVSDNGSGMTDDIHKKVFNPFFTTKFQGRGLGLSAAYGIVSNHNGWISIDSKPGNGTTAKIYIPLLERKIVTKPEKDLMINQSKSGLILIVDDEKNIRELTSAMLKHIGYNTISAENGAKALSIIEKLHNKIDVILLDLMLPDIHGRVILSEIKNNWPDLKTIVFTGTVLEDNPVHADGYISKPISLAELHKTIINIVERRKSKRYLIPDGMFAYPEIFPKNRNQVINLSAGGLAFKFYEGFCFLKKDNNLSIISDAYKLKIDKIPYKFIQENHFNEGSNIKSTGRIQFTQLSEQQFYLIDSFLCNLTPPSIRD